MFSWRRLTVSAVYAAHAIFSLLLVSTDSHGQAPNSTQDMTSTEALTEKEFPQNTEKYLPVITSARITTVGFYPRADFTGKGSDKVLTSLKESHTTTDSPCNQDAGCENADSDGGTGSISATDTATRAEDVPDTFKASTEEISAEWTLEEDQDSTSATLPRHHAGSEETEETATQSAIQDAGQSTEITDENLMEQSTVTRNDILDLINSGTMSKAQSDKVFAALTYVSIPLAAVGVVLTSFSVTVFLQPGMRGPCSSYLVALGIAELLYLLTTFASLASAVIYGTDGTSVYAYLVIGLHVSSSLVVAFRRVAFVITLVVSAERFLVVTFPLKSWRVGRHPVLISSCVYGIVIALHAIYAARFEIFPRGLDTYGFRSRDWWQDNEEVMNGVLIAIQILFTYIPLFGTLVLNVLTTIALYHHRRKARRLRSTRAASSCNSGDTQTTVTILVSTFVFVVLSLPSYASVIASVFLDDYRLMKREHYLHLILIQATLCLEIFSNVADFFAYLSLSRRFRATLTLLLCRGIMRARFKVAVASKRTSEEAN